MKLMQGILAFSVIIGIANTQAPGCERSQCNWKRFDHYIARACEPLYEGGSCCPSSFECASEEEQGMRPDACYYKGKEYNDRESIPIEHECSAACFCSSSNPGQLAEVVCANVECPSLFNPPKPGCRDLFSPGSCCATDEECISPELGTRIETRSEPDCSWKNETGQFGDEMYFDEEPCQKCVCTSNFTDPRGPGCSKIDCGFEFRYRSRVHEGCTPVFFEDSCCSSDWVCPGDNRIVEVEEPPQQNCILGNLTIPVGSPLLLSDCKMRCHCQTPPELTCTHYRSCELAQERDKSPVCPEVSCPPDCRVELDGATGCSNCFCGNATQTCPEPTCGVTCASQTIQFDQALGCYVCKCESEA